jgi:hypothetical protein
MRQDDRFKRVVREHRKRARIDQLDSQLGYQGRKEFD